MRIGQNDKIFFSIDSSLVRNQIYQVTFLTDWEKGFFDGGGDHFIFIDDRFIEVFRVAEVVEDKDFIFGFQAGLFLEFLDSVDDLSREAFDF